MVSSDMLLELLPPFQNELDLKKKDQGTNDIIKEILIAHKQYASSYDLVSSFFWQGDPISTAKCIFDFAKQNIKYSIEPTSRQTVKSPSAIIATGFYNNGLNDCKHYSLFSAGVLDSLQRMGYCDIDIYFRFANYEWGKYDPQHVFVVMVYDGKEYWIDPVFDSFDERNSYVNKFDKKVNMALYSLSGARRKKIGDASSNNAVSIPAEIARGAYILMIAHNMLGSANSLYNILSNGMASTLQQWWESNGGVFSELQAIAAQCRNVTPTNDLTNSSIPLYAAAVPMLSEITKLAPSDMNASDALQIGYNALSQYHKANAGIGSILTDVSSVSSLIPGVGTAVSTGLGVLSSIFPGLQGSTYTPSGRVTQTVTNLASTLSSYGLTGPNGIYSKFAQSDNAGALNMVVSMSDGDSVMVYNGIGVGTYEPVGTSLSRTYGGNLKALAQYVTTSGYSPTSADMTYWNWLKGIAAGTTPIPTVAATSVPATGTGIVTPPSTQSNWPLYIMIGGVAYLIFKH